MGAAEQTRKQLASLTPLFFGLDFDRDNKQWVSDENFSVDYLQADLYTVCRDLIHKIIITELFYGEKNKDKAGLTAELELLVEKGLVVDLRKLLVVERQQNNNSPGSGTGAKFVSGLADILKNEKSNNDLLKLKSAVGAFQSDNLKKNFRNLEAKLLHKDSMPTKRDFKRHSYTIWGGIPVKAKTYRVTGVNTKEIFEVLEKMSCIVELYLSYLGIPKDLPFFHALSLKWLISADLRVYNVSDTSLVDKVEVSIIANMPKTIELIGWRHDES